MTFSPDQISMLEAKLDKGVVKSREQGGRKVSYIEGWQTVAEANRIFGFDAWNRETVDIRCVAEHDRKIGKEPNTRNGHGVSYVARVRVTVNGIIREGVGAGHGIDVDLGLAHESAIKEAETDAMKRALMTFGNPFGLALYDKTMANVGEVDEGPTESERRIVAALKNEIDAATNADTLKDWWASEKTKGLRRQIPKALHSEVEAHAGQRLKALSPEQKAA